MNQTIQKIYEDENYSPDSWAFNLASLAVIILFLMGDIINNKIGDITLYVLLGIFFSMTIYYIFSKGIKTVIIGQYNNPNPIVYVTIMITAFSIQAFVDILSYWCFLFYIPLTLLFFIRYLKNNFFLFIKKSGTLILAYFVLFVLITFDSYFPSSEYLFNLNYLFLIFVIWATMLIHTPLLLIYAYKFNKGKDTRLLDKIYSVTNLSLMAICLIEYFYRIYVESYGFIANGALLYNLKLMGFYSLNLLLAFIFHIFARINYLPKKLT